MSLIQLNNVCKNYRMGDEAHTVLNKISLEIKSGELVALMGPSGSGKSTMMNIIGLLDTPSSGKYHFEGKDVATLSDNQRAIIRNQRIGFVFQQFFLLPKLNALDNVALPLSYQGCTKKEAYERAHAMLEQVGLAEKSAHKPNELSGGQQQRVALARALVCEPSLILADEPTGALDSRTSAEVMELLLNLHRDNYATLVIVTHDRQVGSACTRQIKIHDGRILQEEYA